MRNEILFHLDDPKQIVLVNELYRNGAISQAELYRKLGRCATDRAITLFRKKTLEMLVYLKNYSKDPIKHELEPILGCFGKKHNGIEKKHYRLAQNVEGERISEECAFLKMKITQK